MILILKHKYLLLMILFSLCFIKLYAKPALPKPIDTIAIKVKVGTVWYSFNVYKSGKIIKIVYSRFNLFQVIQDSSYKRLVNEMKNAPDDIKKRDSATNEIKKLAELYKKPQLDSISLNVNTDTAYSHLIDQVNLASMEELEMDQNPPKDGRYRLVLDGSSVFLKRTGPSGLREVSVHSPIPEHYPLLCKILTQTAKVCRDGKKNALLDNFGY